ncbi:hypothetical protein [Corynebacterium mustelae]|uniref:hypothetical protein n=1 Tax=Corynebacterium mustelae TaxID=571915 RepID=UPI000AB1B877|nr:hypothetical protein [Corynebacterium mustelae]
MLKTASRNPDFLGIPLTAFQPSFEQHWNIAKNTPVAAEVFDIAVAAGWISRD